VADIFFTDLFEQIAAMAKLPPIPDKLGALMERVKNYPKIKEYRESKK
jgi:hypothetical protein